MLVACLFKQVTSLHLHTNILAQQVCQTKLSTTQATQVNLSLMHP